MVSKKILRMGAQKTPIQKTYEINTGQDSLNIDFLGANRQFNWIELSIVYNQSDKHTTTYDSYNVELAAKTVKSIKISNFTETYCLTNEKKYDTDNLTQKYFLYNQCVVWSCGGCSTAPRKNYINNPVYQELIDEQDYCSDTSDERISLDLRANEAEKLENSDSKISLHLMLKSVATKNLTVRVWAHSIGEYLCILSKNGLTLRHRTYAINQEDEELLE